MGRSEHKAHSRPWMGFPQLQCHVAGGASLLDSPGFGSVGGVAAFGSSGFGDSGGFSGSSFVLKKAASSANVLSAALPVFLSPVRFGSGFGLAGLRGGGGGCCCCGCGPSP